MTGRNSLSWWSFISPKKSKRTVAGASPKPQKPVKHPSFSKRMYSIWGKFAVSPCCVSSKKLYISTHSYSHEYTGVVCAATHRRNCSTTFACTSRLLSGGAGLWAYKLDQTGFEEWVWDQNKGGKEYHCWKTPRHVNRAITLCFSARTTCFCDFPVAHNGMGLQNTSILHL